MKTELVKGLCRTILYILVPPHVLMVYVAPYKLPTLKWSSTKPLSPMCEPFICRYFVLLYVIMSSVIVLNYFKDSL